MCSNSQSQLLFLLKCKILLFLEICGKVFFSRIIFVTNQHATQTSEMFQMKSTLVFLLSVMCGITMAKLRCGNDGIQHGFAQNLLQNDCKGRLGWANLYVVAKSISTFKQLTLFGAYFKSSFLIFLNHYSLLNQPLFPTFCQDIRSQPDAKINRCGLKSENSTTEAVLISKAPSIFCSSYKQVVNLKHADSDDVHEGFEMACKSVLRDRSVSVCRTKLAWQAVIHFLSYRSDRRHVG